MLAPPVRSADAPPAAHARVGLCRFEAPAGEQRLVDGLAGDAAGILGEVSRELGAAPLAAYRVVLVPPRARWTPADPPLDSTLNHIDAEVPPWAAGYTLPARRLIVIRVAEAARYPYGTVQSVLAHEVSHLALHDAVGDRAPRWLDEGLATWQGRHWSLVDAFALSASMMLRPLPPLARADALFLAGEADARTAYAQAFTFTAWSVHRYGEGFPARLVRALARHDVPEAWAIAAGEPLDAAEQSWRRSAAVRFRWIPWLGTSGMLWVIATVLASLAAAHRRRLAAAQRARMPDLPWHPDDPLQPGGPAPDPWDDGAPPGAGEGPRPPA